MNLHLLQAELRWGLIVVLGRDRFSAMQKMPPEGNLEGTIANKEKNSY